MMMRRILFVVAVIGMIAGSASARPNVQVLPLPSPYTLVPENVGPEHGSGCTEVYLNVDNLTNVYAPGGGEYGDDLHTTATGDWPLCAFDFGYYLPTATTTDAVVAFYRNDPSDAARGPLVAGPFVITGLPGSDLHLIHFEANSGIVGPDVWMTVEFSNPDAGLLTANPPTIGSSHDRDMYEGLIYDSPYGGDPPASYVLGVYASPPTPTNVSTWGRVKSAYR